MNSQIRFCLGMILVCSVVVPNLHRNDAHATTISLPAVKDNTLLRYDPNDPNTDLNSNGSGNFFSAGRTLSRDEIRRGLLQFDFSTVPDNMQVAPGSVNLRLRVIGVPRRDTSPRPFWFVALAGLNEPWGEGASNADIAVSGSGSGAPAQLGDATWFHTSYDPSIHDPATFTPGGTGFWPQLGALGGSAILDPAAMFGPFAGFGGSTEDYLDFTSTGMEDDINLWISDPTKNFGWLMIGDEGVTGDNASSKRDFAGRQHANADFHPVLTFDVVPICEPATVVLAAIASFVAAAIGRHRKQRRATENDADTE